MALMPWCLLVAYGAELSVTTEITIPVGLRLLPITSSPSKPP